MSPPRWRTPGPARRSPPSRGRTRRAAALSILLATPLTAAAAGFLAADPMRLSRAAARAQVMVLGGSYEGREGVILQSGVNDCGPAALANVLKTLGMGAPSPDSLEALAGTGPEGTRASGLVRAAATLGLDLALTRVDWERRGQVPTPFIAWVHESHFVAVTERTQGRFTVLDPQVGRYSIGESAFRSIWTGEALVLARPPGTAAATYVAAPHSPVVLEEAS